MARRLNGFCGRRGAAIAALLCSGWLADCRAGDNGSNSVSVTNSATSEQNAATESSRIATRIGKLDEIALPDEWYMTKGATLAARFDATAKAMPASEGKPVSGRELEARYQNGGRPFIHSIWFNRPLFCPKCTNTSGDGSITMVSVARGLSVIVTQAELHEVTAHGGAFPLEKLSILKKILDPS